jgi:hypothetical protein
MLSFISFEISKECPTRQFAKVCGCSFLTFWSFFHILDLHNKTHVALASLRSNIYKDRIEKRTSPNLVIMAIVSAHLLKFELPIVFTIECT